MVRNAHATLPGDHFAHASLEAAQSCQPKVSVAAGTDGNAVSSDASPTHGRVRPLMPGTCIAGKYIICDVLGVGGAAVVYAAEQVSLKRVVAFKLYPVGGAMAAQLLQRFEREAQILARVNHENVLAVFDAGRMPDGAPYLIVQRLRGDSLATRLQSGPLSLDEAVDLTHQVLSALVALGDAGITHRDVKPDNLVLDCDPEGRKVLKLVDFGIAKHIEDEASRELDQMVGTPGYMAPEQVRGDAIDPRADLYALGATLYEMLTGRTPHRDEPHREAAEATLCEPITNVRVLCPNCPEALADVVMRALAREPGERFASAREMMHALEACQAALAPSATLSLSGVLPPSAALPDSESVTPLASVRAAALDEDTLRISTSVATTLATGVPRRSKLHSRASRVAAGLALAASVALAHQLSKGSLLGSSPPRPGTFAEASESSIIEPLTRSYGLATELVLQSVAGVVQLVSHVHVGAREVLQTLHRPGLTWGEQGAPGTRVAGEH